MTYLVIFEVVSFIITLPLILSGIRKIGNGLSVYDILMCTLISIVPFFNMGVVAWLHDDIKFFVPKKD
jgi:hypothetical protein